MVYNCGMDKTLESISNYRAEKIDNLINNFHNEIKIVFSDVDGTIIPLESNFSSTQIPQSIVVASQKLKALNIPLVVTTGRSLNEVTKLSQIIQTDLVYYILLHGAEIFNSEFKIFHQDYIDKSLLKEIVETIDDFCRTHNCDTKFYFVYEGKQYSTKPFIFPYNGKEATIITSLDYFGSDYLIGKLLFSEEDVEKKLKLQHTLLNKFPQLEVNLGGSSYCDITNKTATKGNAVKILAQHLGIDLKNAAVFGDAQNDKSMFDVVNESGGLTVAMDNAVDGLKQSAKFVTKSVYEDGVLYALEKIIENNNRLSTNVIETYSST